MQQRPSLARDYFQQIIDKGENAFGFIAGLSSTPTPTFETDWLDFKGWWDLNDEKVKDIWSKALSGFGDELF